MADKRSKRKSNVVRFLTQLDKDRLLNLSSVIEKAKTLELEGFDFNLWSQSTWTITAGRLLKITGKNTNKVTLNFLYAPSLKEGAIEGEWADFIKSIIVIRFHRSHQSVTNQRTFIAAVSYVASEMSRHGQKIFQLTPEFLNSACKRITQDYSEGAAYNMHKAIGEFAAHCDANHICNVLLNYKYAGMRRPLNTGGLDHKRLDDPDTLNTEGDKLVDPKVFKIIGELYLNVPVDHKYRFYVLVLSLIAFLGRRFSEISMIPNQEVKRDEEGEAYLKYFPRKTSQGDVFTPLMNTYIATEVVPIVEPIISELRQLCSSARKTATEMHVTKGADILFLIDYADDKRFYKEDLQGIGVPGTVLGINGWIRQNGFAFCDQDKLTAQGKLPNSPFWYTTKVGIAEYCKKDYKPSSIEPIHVDQHGEKYYLKDMLLVKNLSLSSGTYAHWLATQMTHSMMTTFLRYFPELASEYASSSIEVDFTSHRFRHTLNTLLDEGGLSDMLQTEYFSRSNPKDTKAYQHTSREKKALLLRADIKEGKVGGRLVERIRTLPVNIQDAVLAARVHAVHDVGTGICIHNFIQTPCERHLQCSADCDDYVWAKEDEGRKEELKRMYAVTFIARDTAEKKVGDSKPKRSADWLLHNDKKLKVLTQQMRDNKIDPFDPVEYLEKRTYE